MRTGQIILVSILTILIGIGIYILIVTYPIVAGRDWLEYLSDFGKSMGSLALLGLVFQLIWRANDSYNSSKPQLEITSVTQNKISDKSNATGTFTHIEDSEDDLPNGPQFAEYRKYYGAINPSGDRFMTIAIKNLQSGPYGTAYRLRLNVKIHLTKFAGGKVASVQEFYCPGNQGIDVISGTEQLIHINISATNTNMRFITMDITDIECYNTNDKKFSRRKLNFKTHSVPVQALI